MTQGETMTSDNLPLVLRAGGEVAEVLSWDQHSGLSAVVKNAIARFVINNPEFKSDVDLLADLVSFHGIDFDVDIRQFTRDYGADIVHLANQYLYDTARQSRREHTFQYIEDAVRALANLRDAGLALDSIEQIDRYIERLGGFEAASLMTIQEIRDEFSIR